MIRCFPVRLLPVLSLLCTIIPGFAQVESRAGSRFSSPTRYETPGRENWQLPDSVLRVLGLKKGQVVADIGAASGYFARRYRYR